MIINASDPNPRTAIVDRSREENARNDRIHGGGRHLVRAADGSWQEVTKAERDLAERCAAERRYAERLANETPRVKLTPQRRGKVQKFAYRSWNANNVAIYNDTHGLPELKRGSRKQIEYASSFRPELIEQVTKLTESTGFDYELGRRIRVVVRGIRDAEWFLARRDRPAARIVEELSANLDPTDIILPEVQTTTTCKSDELICGVA